METLPHVKIDQFEGPFDLLLELAEAQQIDLTVVSLSALTEAFLEHVRTTPLTPAAQVDFIVVAATLLVLKIQQMLPETAVEIEESAEQLTERLRRYRYYREQGLALQTQWGVRPLLAAPQYLTVSGIAAYPTITPGDLSARLAEVIHRIPARVFAVQHLRRPGMSIAACAKRLLARLADGSSYTLAEALPLRDRTTVAATLLAVLDLSRRQEIAVTQTSPFAPLVIVRSAPPSP